MSAALQLSRVWGAANAQPLWPVQNQPEEFPPVTGELDFSVEEESSQEDRPSISMAFYRKHTENLLRRYLYASMQVGRTPSVLGDPVGRGWASSRKVRTFEDAVVFVLDVEACLKKLSRLDRAVLNRLVIQEYTQGEVATMLGVSVRTVNAKLHRALDRMTELLLDSNLLELPH